MHTTKSAPVQFGMHPQKLPYLNPYTQYRLHLKHPQLSALNPVSGSILPSTDHNSTKAHSNSYIRNKGQLFHPCLL